MFRHDISADVPAPRTGPRLHGLLGCGLALSSHSVLDSRLWIQTHLQQVRHMWCLAEIFAKRPWTPVKTAQLCLLFILHAGPWHLRAGKHRYTRSMIRHHDPLVTKLLQRRVVRKCEVLLRILVHLSFVLSIQTHACMQLCVHEHAQARSCRTTKKTINKYVMPSVRLNPVMYAHFLRVMLLIIWR